MRRFVKTTAASGAAFILAACASNAPPYQPSIPNVEAWKAGQIKPVHVAGFSALPGAVGATSIGIRASSMTSPVGSGFADYLASAITQELELARLLDPKSSIELTAVLIRNDISAAGLSTNSGEIEARFIVKREGQVRYDGVKRVTSEWESSVLGAIAIPRAREQYPLLVQTLIAAAIADADFVGACR